MFLATLDLQTVLFGLLLLPIGGALLMAVFMRARRRQRRAMEQASLLTMLFSQAPFGLLQLDQRHQVVAANDQAKHLLGLEADDSELPDQPWRDLLVADLSENGRYRTVEINSSNDRDEGQSIDAARVVRWWVRTQEQGAVVALFDLTNEQGAEQRANRLLSDLSHELRTPLATLMTHLEVLSLPELTSEVHQQSIGFMKDETNRLSRLSNRTLELGRLQASVAIEPQSVEIDTLAESVASQMQIEAAARESHIHTEADDELPPVWGDPDQLRQVFLNLLDNAIKYGGENNRIVVSLHRSPTGVVCTIQDSGPGISSEHLANLEKRYYRAASQTIPGSGLGLAMVREILRRHNSKLEISSRVDGAQRGTEMRFVLAVVEDGRP